MTVLFFLALAAIIHIYAINQGQAGGGDAIDALAVMAIFAAIYFFIRDPHSVLYILQSLLKTSENRPKIPPPRDPGKPSTPEETKRAQEHLRVALAYRDEAFKQTDNFLQLHVLASASEAIAKARALDPHATAFEEKSADGKEPLKYTQDELSGELLYSESLLYSKQAEATYANILDTLNDRMMQRRHQKDYKKELNLALNAIQKAIRYNPNSALNHCQLARVLGHLEKPAESKAAANRAFELAPNDIEVLKLHTSYD